MLDFRFSPRHGHGSPLRTGRARPSHRTGFTTPEPRRSTGGTGTTVLDSFYFTDHTATRFYALETGSLHNEPSPGGRCPRYTYIALQPNVQQKPRHTHNSHYRHYHTQVTRGDSKVIQNQIGLPRGRGACASCLCTVAVAILEARKQHTLSSAPLLLHSSPLTPPHLSHYVAPHELLHPRSHIARPHNERHVSRRSPLSDAQQPPARDGNAITHRVSSCWPSGSLQEGTGQSLRTFKTLHLAPCTGALRAHARVHGRSRAVARPQPQGGASHTPRRPDNTAWKSSASTCSLANVVATANLGQP